MNYFSKDICQSLMDTPKKHMKEKHSMHLHTANRPMYPASTLRVKIVTLLVKLLVKTPSKSSATSHSCPLKGNHYPHLYCIPHINFTYS